MSLLYISSHDHLSSGNSSNCTIPLPTHWTKIHSVSLESFIVPNTSYNIRAGVNDYIPFRRSSTNYAFQITPGSYTITSLLSAIQTGMNAADANTYTCTYSAITMKATIAGSGAFILNFATGTNASTSCWRELGFSQADTSSTTSHTGSNVVSLEKPSTLFINIPELRYPVSTSNSADYHTFIVPLTENAGNLVFFSTTSQFDQRIAFSSPISFSELTFLLKDRSNVASSLNGGEWAMILKLE